MRGKYHADFGYECIMGGSWTIDYVRMVRRTFKLQIVARATPSSPDPQALAALAISLAFHFSNNDDYNAVVVSLEECDNDSAVVLIEDNGEGLKVRFAQDVGDLRPERVDVLGPTLLRDFSALCARVYGAYHSHLELKVAVAEGFKAECDADLAALRSRGFTPPLRNAAEDV